MTLRRYTHWVRGWTLHSARVAIAAAASLAVAGLFKMPESYWAPLTTIIVMESTLGAAWAISKTRLVGTALGAAGGCAVAMCLRPGILSFGVGVFALGLVCAVLSLNRSAYRFAALTLGIVVLATHGREPWLVAVHRFLEVSIGIAVALIVTAVWPAPEDRPPASK